MFIIRDRSLIRQVKFYPYYNQKKKGGGGYKQFEVVLAQEPEDVKLYIATKSVHPLKGGGGGAQQVLPCLKLRGKGRF